LVERAKEDIYFAQHDRELLEKLRGQLRKVYASRAELRCPKGQGLWESFTYDRFAPQWCNNCGGFWLDKGELGGIGKVSGGPLGAWTNKFLRVVWAKTNREA
jgi:hypothetical protein